MLIFSMKIIKYRNIGNVRNVSKFIGKAINIKVPRKGLRIYDKTVMLIYVV